MYAANPPALVPVAGLRGTPLPLRLTRVHHLWFGPGRQFLTEAADHRLAEYHRDLAEVHSIAVREDFPAGTRNTFVEMAEPLLPLVTASSPPDLIMLAHATPDSDLRQGIAGFLTDALPGDPFPIGVTDHGTVAPFTALRVAGEYVRSDGFHTVLLVILEQRCNPYQLTVPENIEVTRDCLVALELSVSASHVGVHQFADVPAEGVPGLVREVLSGLPRWAKVTMLAGAQVPELSTVVSRFRRAPAGLACTGVWSLLDPYPAPDDTTHVVLVEYDGRLRYLSVCVVESTGDNRWEVAS